MSHLLTLPEAAQRLRKSKRWLQDWLAQNPVDVAGKPYCSRLGRTALFREDAIERLEKIIRTKEKRPTFIYFIELEGHIKIGRSDNWKKRLHGIQSNSPFEARLLLVLKGTDGREKDFHKRFAEHRGRGEWFRDHPCIREYIKSRGDWCVTKRGGTLS